MWHPVLPGRLLRVVSVRREAKRAISRRGPRKPPPVLEAFFTTNLSLSPEDIFAEYHARWAVEIAIRDANAFAGLGQEQCRKRQRILGANTLRLVRTAARTLWFIAHVEHEMAMPLCRYRPGTDRK